MIAEFWFRETVHKDHVALRLLWNNGTPQGSVISPPQVRDTLEQLHITARAEDEPMNLGIALGYAVTIATLSQTPLTLTGDCSAWPDA